MGIQTMNKRQLKQELADRDAVLKCAREFNMVGDPTRLKICYLLCRHKELPVSEIADIVGVSVSAVSHTLKKLQRADIVANRREFRTVFYRLKASSFTKLLKQRLSHHARVWIACTR